MSDVVIRITAVDGASSVLRKIGDAAKKSADELERGGAKGKKGMEDVAKGARNADTQLRTFERTSLAVGAAMGAVALGLAKASAAYQTQERQLDALTRMYGEAAQGAIDYAEQIQLTTKYSNDAARDSLVLLNTLTMNYGMQQDQIEALLSRSADLAQMHGKSLTEVTQMVSNALRGEGEYIEQIGVSMNQMFVASEAAARGLEDFIYGMTAAEQAAFRYTLLMEQTAAAQGYAMETATGTRGAIALVTNEFQDATQTFAGFLGPVRDVAAQFNSYALWLPLIASQVGRVSAVLINSARSFQSFNNMTATLGASAGPIGAGIAVITAALTYLGLKWTEERQAQAQAAAQAENTARSYEALEQAIASMFASGSVNAAEFAGRGSNVFTDWMNDWQENVDTFAQSLDNPSWWEEAFDATIGRLGEGAASILTGGWTAAQREAMMKLETTREDFVKTMQISQEEEQQINASMQRVFQLAANPNVDVAAFEAEWDTFLSGLFADVATGAIPSDQISEEVDKFANRKIEDIARTAARVEMSIDELERAFEMDNLRLDGWTEAQVAQIEIFDRLATGIDTYKQSVLGLSSIGVGTFNYMDALPDISHLRLTAEETALVTASQERLREAMLSGEWNNVAINDNIALLNQLFQSGQIDGATYTTMMVALAREFPQLGTAAGAAIDKMREFGSAGEEAAVGIEKLSEAMIQGASDAANYAAEQAQAQLKFAASHREAIRQRLTDMRELQAAQEEFAASYAESIGLDDPLTQVNLTSLRSEASALASDFAAANNELDTMYRIIVGNTDAIKSQADAILTWAEGLINVRGELGRIDELVNDGLITGTSGVFDDGSQYAAAQDAYDSIAESTARINDNLDAVQAIQAPIIAQSMEWQADMTENLLAQDAATQRVTLGWMDATSAAQAFQVVQQLMLLQSGELGAQSEETMNTIVQGAVMANPLLFDMLESMGVISGTPVDFQVNTEALEGAQSELEALTDNIKNLVDTLREMYNLEPLDVPITVTPVMDQEGIGWNQDWLAGQKPVEVPATPVFSDDGTGGAGWGNALPPVEVEAIPVFKGGGASPTGAYGGGGASIPPIEVPAVAVFGDEPMAGIPDVEPIEVPAALIPDSAQLSAAVQVWTGSSFDGPMFYFQQDSAAVSAGALVWMGATFDGPTFNFIPNYSPVNLSAGITAGASYDGPTFNFVANDSNVRSVIGRYTDGAVIATQYVNIVARTTGGSGILNERHGGALHFATGGVVPFIAAENNNPEIAHFRNGGSALLDREGMYFAPPMTMIEPSNNVRGKNIGGASLSVNIYGNVYGMDDLVDQISDQLVPVMTEVIYDSRDAQPGIR